MFVIQDKCFIESLPLYLLKIDFSTPTLPPKILTIGFLHKMFKMIIFYSNRIMFTWKNKIRPKNIKSPVVIFR